VRPKQHKEAAIYAVKKENEDYHLALTNMLNV
jgi:hypothetical protein